MESEIFIHAVYPNSVPRNKGIFEELGGDRVLDFSLDSSLQGSGSIDGIVAHIGDIGQGGRGDFDANFLIREEILHPLELDCHDLSEFSFIQSMENNCVI